MLPPHGACGVPAQPSAHARIASIDTGAARSAPDVIHVAIGADIAKVCTPWVGILTHFSGLNSPPQYPVAIDRVLWRGEPLVAVVAETRAAAEDALDLVHVDFEERPVVADMETALDPSTPVIHPEIGHNEVFGLKLNKGDVDAAFDSAHGVVAAELRSGAIRPSRSSRARSSPTTTRARRA